MGNWKSIVEMEECLTLDELQLLVEAQRKAEYNKMRFAAGLKGIDLDENSEGSPEEAFRRAQLAAEAELAGKSEEDYEFELIGIEVVREGDVN